MEERDLIVVKYGSSSVTAGEFSVEQNLKDNTGWFVYELSKLHKNHDLIVVTSGSVAVGSALWPDLADRHEDEVNQFLAMSGNPYVMKSWIDGFRAEGIKSGELLLTHKEIDDDAMPDSPGSELRRALRQTLDLGAVAIVNENDALSRQELAELHYGGDNDGLAGHIARSMGASSLFLMTETNGVKDRTARIPRVLPNERSWNSVRAHAGASNSKGRGGMKAKVEAAILAAQNGIDSYIANAHKYSFSTIRSGKIGTHFHPVEQKHSKI